MDLHRLQDGNGLFRLAAKPLDDLLDKSQVELCGRRRRVL